MQTAILTLHVIVCVILVVLVLLQSGREGMGVIFGGGGNSSVFGSAGAGGILAKLTTFLAVVFICTSLGYNIMNSSAKKSAESVLDVQFEEVSAATSKAPEGTASAKPISAEPLSEPISATQNSNADSNSVKIPENPKTTTENSSDITSETHVKEGTPKVTPQIDSPAKSESSAQSNIPSDSNR